MFFGVSSSIHAYSEPPHVPAWPRRTGQGQLEDPEGPARPRSEPLCPRNAIPRRPETPWSISAPRGQRSCGHRKRWTKRSAACATKCLLCSAVHAFCGQPRGLRYSTAPPAHRKQELPARGTASRATCSEVQTETRTHENRTSHPLHSSHATLACALTLSTASLHCGPQEFLPYTTGSFHVHTAPTPLHGTLSLWACLQPTCHGGIPWTRPRDTLSSHNWT